MPTNRIVAAGNTEVPAYLTLVGLGYQVDCVPLDATRERWAAARDDVELFADSPLELLGLCCVWQKRGSNWRASDEDIGAFMDKFYPDGPNEPLTRRIAQGDKS